MSTLESAPKVEGKYVCRFPKCGKRFMRNYNVQVHMRTHTGEQPFLCPYPKCEQTFKWRSTLRAHYSYEHRMDLQSTKKCLMNSNGSSSDKSRSGSGEEGISSKIDNHRDETLGALDSAGFYIQFVFRDELKPEDFPEGKSLIQCTEEGCDYYFNYMQSLQLHLREHRNQQR
mmetsp:Transcript_12700/g.51218  ORF Transcript_12700/g.51218 Transcript_12700/m.51218 type:complete len:172 (-) Transcript_12700:135-650(-)